MSNDLDVVDWLRRRMGEWVAEEENRIVAPVLTFRTESQHRIYTTPDGRTFWAHSFVQPSGTFDYLVKVRLTKEWYLGRWVMVSASYEELVNQPHPLSGRPAIPHDTAR